MRTLAGAGISDARAIFNYQGEHALLKRTPTLDELGGAALYLLSDLSGAVTGEVHFVDCGYNVVAMPSLEALKAQDGRTSAVRQFVVDQPEGRELLTRLRDLLAYLLPRYQKEGKAYLTVAVGCTGGRHRSVALVEELQGFVEAQGIPVTVTHRDVDRAG